MLEKSPESARIIYRRGSAIPIRNTLINRYLFRQVLTRIMANSLEVKRTILANNRCLVPDEKSGVIYNGVYLPPYNTGISLRFIVSVTREIVLGSAGTVVEEKGHLHLLEMMQLLEESKYHFKLLDCRRGKVASCRSRRKARKLDVEERVEFLGFVEDMPAFFHSLDIFLLPLTYEGFGYVIAEAMASRKPVVAFDIKSSAEIIVTW